MAAHAIDKSERVLAFLEKYKGGAGLFGKFMRGEEIAANLLGLSDQSDRVQMRRDILALQESAQRVLAESNGRPLKANQEKIDAVFAGLNSGDTGPNTRRAWRELIQEIKTKHKDLTGRLTGGFDPDKRTSGEDIEDPGREMPPPPAGKKPPPANWLDQYPTR